MEVLILGFCLEIFFLEKRGQKWGCILHMDAHYIQVNTVTESENLQNSDCLFNFLFEDFRLCSHYNNLNYSAWQVDKPLFSSSVAICHLAFSEISLSI